MSEKNCATNASLSTMWAIKNYPDLNDFFTASRQLGFSKIELNHQVDEKMLSMVNLDHYQFSSVHEPCPVVIPVKELVERDWLVSAIDEQARTQGVNAVKKSIDLARQLEVPVVVVHCGIIPYPGHHEHILRKLFKAGNTQSEEYRSIKSQFENIRREHVGVRMQAVKKSILELIEYANLSNTKLGIENRYHYMDIPSPEEMGEILNLADSAKIGFIYDVGHAQTLDRLGFYPHEEWLRHFSSRMFGCHLHDVIGITDHYAPGLGEINFKHIASYLPEKAFRTMEVLPGNTLAQVRDGMDTLLESGCIRYLSVP